MRKIHFDDLRSWFWIGFLLLSLVLILIGTFEFVDFENPKIHKLLSVSGFLLQFIFYSRMFWYKNYFQWNKKGGHIRINSFWPKQLIFEEISKAELNDKVLEIHRITGKDLTFDLNHIDDEDVQKLHQIILKLI